MLVYISQATLIILMDSGNTYIKLFVYPVSGCNLPPLKRGDMIVLGEIQEKDCLEARATVVDTGKENGLVYVGCSSVSLHIFPKLSPTEGEGISLSGCRTLYIKYAYASVNGARIESQLSGSSASEKKAG